MQDIWAELNYLFCFCVLLGWGGMGWACLNNWNRCSKLLRSTSMSTSLLLLTILISVMRYRDADDFFSFRNMNFELEQCFLFLSCLKCLLFHDWCGIVEYLVGEKPIEGEQGFILSMFLTCSAYGFFYSPVPINPLFSKLTHNLPAARDLTWQKGLAIHYSSLFLCCTIF